VRCYPSPTHGNHGHIDDAAPYEEIKRERPALSHPVLGYVIAVMTERLSFADRLIGVLQR